MKRAHETWLAKMSQIHQSGRSEVGRVAASVVVTYPTVTVTNQAQAAPTTIDARAPMSRSLRPCQVMRANTSHASSDPTGVSGKVSTGSSTSTSLFHNE